MRHAWARNAANFSNKGPIHRCGADALVRGRPPGRPVFSISSEAEEGVAGRRARPTKKVCGIARGRVRYDSRRWALRTRPLRIEWRVVEIRKRKCWSI
jgi:hypothetical protein